MVWRDPNTVCGLGCVRSSQVVFKLQAVVSQFQGAEGQFTGVQLKDGSVVEADLCIVGAGMWMCMASAPTCVLSLLLTP